MKRRNVPGGIAWSCTRCDGRTATLGLLRKSLAPETLRAMVDRAGEPDARPGVRCPSCLRGMREITLRTPDGYQELDVCRPCTFVWLDPGEFSAVAATSPEGPETSARAAESRPPTFRDPKSIEAVARMKLGELKERQKQERKTPDAGWKWLPGLLGMPVEFDDHEPAARPVFTWSLVSLVSIISVLAFSNIDELARQFGFLPAAPWRMGGLTAITSFFLHVNLWHLAGNMYFLWILGDNSEDVLGAARYLLLLLLATIMGCVLFALTSADPAVPAIGASGGISGLIAYYALRFPRMRVGVLILFIWWLRLPTKVALLAWVGLQVYGAFIAQDNVAYMAHLGGAVVGVAFWGFEQLTGRQAPERGGPRGSPQERYGHRAGRYEKQGERKPQRYTRR